VEQRPAVRLIGVGASGLAERAHQLSLWDTPDQKERRLIDALDELRERFGNDVVRSGRAIKKTKPEDDFIKKTGPRKKS